MTHHRSEGVFSFSCNAAELYYTPDYLEVFLALSFPLLRQPLCVLCWQGTQRCLLSQHQTHILFINGCREEGVQGVCDEKGVELGRWDINIWIIDSPDCPAKFSLSLCLWWESSQPSQHWNNGGHWSSYSMSHPHTHTHANTHRLCHYTCSSSHPLSYSSQTRTFWGVFRRQCL